MTEKMHKSQGLPSASVGGSAVSAMVVGRRSNLSHEDFVRQYLNPCRPVIITDAARDWKAYSKWMPEFFKEELGSKDVEVNGKQDKLRDFINLVLTSTNDNPAPYLHGTDILGLFPELMPDIQPHLTYMLPNRLMSRFLFFLWLRKPAMREGFPELLIGGKGGQFPVLHYDGWYTHAFITQLYGDKEFTLYPPEQVKYLYPMEKNWNNSSIQDIQYPNLDRYPLFAKATPLKAIVKEGETIFLPSGWWHTTRMLTTSIAVSLNSVSESNWQQFSKEVVRLLRHKYNKPIVAIAAKVYLAGLGLLLSFLEHVSIVIRRSKEKKGWLV